MSKKSLDANFARGQRKQSRTFENSPDGWKLMLAWFKAMGGKPAHVCMEATGRYSLGVALALHDAGHVVSVVNPAQIRDFARTKLGRNKTDKIDAVLIREYAELFKPGPWAPPSPAMRRLCELQTVRTGMVKAAGQPAQSVPAPNDTDRARAGDRHRRPRRLTSAFAKRPNQQIGPSGTSTCEPRSDNARTAALWGGRLPTAITRCPYIFHSHVGQIHLGGPAYTLVPLRWIETS